MIDQAIFTSVRGREMDGYQVAVASSGVSAEEAKELAMWGPAHDSLLHPRPGARSINFHPLESGRFCISLTTALGAEYSGRGGCQVYTHSLLVDSQQLRQFACDPFRLIDAAMAGGRVPAPAEVPKSLAPFSLIGGAAAVNATLLTRLLRQVEPLALGRLLSATLGEQPMAVVSRTPSRLLFAGLLNLLPVECRSEVSFTTGLRHSPRRPYQLVSLPEDASELRRAPQSLPFAVIDLASEPAPGGAGHPWADYVVSVLKQNHLPEFAAALRLRRPELTFEGLDDLADSLAPATLPATSRVD
ncbi:MAG: hypothetical protein KY475_05410 [Planctomycetes bacterium]|nr:hypothetical protein [Planctomycetota bacterium]